MTAPARTEAEQDVLDAPRFVTTHNWWMQWSGRVDEWHAFEEDWELDAPVGSSRVSAEEAISDLQEKLEDEQ